MAPRNEAIPLPKPLASAPQQPAGHVGGLLPPVTIRVRALEVLARTMRPAVILVVPAECDGCRASVESVMVQSRTHRLRLVLLGSPASRTSWQTWPTRGRWPGHRGPGSLRRDRLGVQRRHADRRDRRARRDRQRGRAGGHREHARWTPTCSTRSERASAGGCQLPVAHRAGAAGVLPPRALCSGDGGRGRPRRGRGPGWMAPRRARRGLPDRPALHRLAQRPGRP